MRRREFFGVLGGAAATWPLAARAQQPATQRRIAIFHPAIPATLLTETGGGSAWRAFFAELRRLGYVEGENLIIERYSAEGHHERYADLAREIVTRNPNVIVTGTNPVVIAFMAATSTIPVVEPLKSVPYNAKLIKSLRHNLLTGRNHEKAIGQHRGQQSAKLAAHVTTSLPTAPAPWRAWHRPHRLSFRVVKSGRPGEVDLISGALAACILNGGSQTQTAEQLNAHALIKSCSRIRQTRSPGFRPVDRGFP